MLVDSCHLNGLNLEFYSQLEPYGTVPHGYILLGILVSSIAVHQIASPFSPTKAETLLVSSKTRDFWACLTLKVRDVKSDWLRIQDEYSVHAHARDSWCRPKAARSLGTRMLRILSYFVELLGRVKIQMTSEN